MKIGIDLDDTICRTTEIVHNRLEEYSKIVNLNPLDIMNDEYLKQEFFNKYLYDIYTNVEIKREVAKVLKRLRNKNNKIIIITARGYGYSEKIDKIMEITKEWLRKNNIEVDDIILSSYGEEKAKICKKNNIDLMIDDDPYNYKKIVSAGIKCILFDDRGKYNLKQDYITNWLDVEKYIERNR